MKKQQGFTLIELMIVVAIIGVLSAFAIPAYKNYVVKSEASTGVATLRAVLTNFDMIQQETGIGPTTLEAIGTTSGAAGSLGTLSLSENAQSGASAVIFTFNTTGVSSQLSGKAATFTKSTSGWSCSSTIPADYKPKGCN
ncbi:pilin [Photobacterium phosphoreum]|uniref:pilin n=1 Tax=Photobacterium phosphoreum TaxID=659 RepID=UPI001E5BC453|nr:pilin [Photobacterium phosphoreum]MCD9507095.1 prepilin-type N-terminal cleavage/methylation domain-containing protein [Photobacterium phosphoreum]MCD9519579.1 prepilin-type N-terminal cleavage/methylation domain-containing protein [Photobacterium phosphoreum]